MTSHPFVREPVLSLFAEWPRHSTREAGEALLGAIETLRAATQLRDLLDCAAHEVLALAAAAAAVVCLERPEAGPQLAFSGAIDRADAEERALSIRELVGAGTSAPYALLDNPAVIVAPFRVGAVSGWVLAERRRTTVDDAELRLLTIFARELAAAAATICLLDQLRQAERIQGVLLETVLEAAAVVVDGRVALLNCAGTKLLARDRKSVIGSPVAVIWPELARLLALGEQVDERPLRFGGRDLLVTVQRIPEGRADAVVRIAERKPAERRVPRAAAANPLFGLGDLVGLSAPLAAVRELAAVAAQSGSSLVIEGESGVGKEVLAQAIHASGPRRGRPFVAVHCAAIPRELLESELFGYEPGAFTGASPQGHAGKFELAQDGSLLLDDIAEMPLDMQAKLLRVLQERAVTRLGGDRPRPVSARIIATSNRPLREAVELGRFRADLFYRLEVLHIFIPPLRQRPEDIRPLVEHFLLKYGAVHGRSARTIGAEALRSLESYSWPGNVRELEHWTESEIHFTPPQATCLDRFTRPLVSVEHQVRAPGVRPVREVERELYGAAIAAAAGDVSRAARGLGISRGKLYRKLRLYGLLPP